MSTNELKTRIKHAYKTESEWSTSDPILLKGEVAYSSDKNNKYKVGDGTNKWSVLSYAKADLVKSDVTTALGYTPPTTNTTYSDATQSAHGLMSTTDKIKLDGIATGANKTTVDSSLSSTSTNPVQNKVINSALAGKSSTSHTHDLSTMINTLSTGTATPNDDDYYVSQYAGGGTTTTTYHRRPMKALFEYIKGKLSTVAVSGSYNDLSNKPTIPSVGNGTVTIKQAGTSKGTFTMNQSGNTTIELTDNNTTYSTGTASTSGLTKLYTGTGTATDGTMTQAALKTALDGKASSTHSHNYAGSSSAGGAANSATKLTTARTIGLGTGVTSTATNFDGSGNITIPVTGINEAYLNWGGKNFAGSYGCIDAAMVPQLGANRFAFMPATGIEIQYSTNGGSTWSTYSTTDADKTNLFNGNTSTYYIGANSSSGIDKSKYQLRVIITTNTAKVYTVLNKFVIYCSTNGSTGSWCSIDAKTKANVDSGTDTWVNFANKVSIEGWSGYNVINTSGITTYGNTSYQYQKLRFTFGVNSHASTVTSSGLQILGIMGFGGVGWTVPSTMARNGHMYTYDASQNVYFPAQVTATQFNGKATALTTSAGSATQPIYFSDGKPVATTYTLGKSVPSNAVFTDTNTWRGIQNNLTSDSTTDSLSAAQGKALKALVDSKASTAVATTSANGLMSKDMVTKLNGIATGANAYSHPTYTAKSSGLYKVTVDGTGHVSAATAVTKSDITALGIPGSDTNTDTKVTQTAVTDSDYTNWRSLVWGASNSGTEGFTPTTVTDMVFSSTGLSVQPSTGTIRATTFKGNLNGNASTATNASKVNNHTVNSDVPSGAKFTDTVYTHPTTSGNKHIPSGGSSGQILRWSADGTAAWGSDNNTDTKVTNTLATTTKAYVTGTTSASTNTGTQVFDTGVYLDTTEGRLHVTSLGVGNAVVSYDSTKKCVVINV